MFVADFHRSPVWDVIGVDVFACGAGINVNQSNQQPLRQGGRLDRLSCWLFSAEVFQNGTIGWIMKNPSANGSDLWDQ